MGFDDVFSSLRTMAENEDAKNDSANTRKRVATLEKEVAQHRQALKKVNTLLKEIIAHINTPKEG
jgi:hypothetical protein